VYQRANTTRNDGAASRRSPERLIATKNLLPGTGRS